MGNKRRSGRKERKIKEQRRKEDGFCFTLSPHYPLVAFIYFGHPMTQEKRNSSVNKKLQTTPLL